MPSWPTDLSDVRTELTQAPDRGVTRLPMASGRTRQQRLYTIERVFQNVSWCFSGAQYKIFQAFVRDTLHRGVDAFTVDLAFGSGLEPVSVSIVEGKYSAGYDSGKWIVSATLEIENPPTIDYD